MLVNRAFTNGLGSPVARADADNMAVRMALAETHAVMETKKFLEQEGVDLDLLKEHTVRK